LQVKKFVKRRLRIEIGNILQHNLEVLQMKIRAVILLLLLNQLLMGQKGLELGPWVQYQSVWILNKTDMDAGPQMDYKNSFNTAYGIQASYGFTKRHGIRSGLIRSVQGQLFTTAEDFLALPGITYKTVLDYFQIPFQYRYSGDLSKSKSVFTFTLGPQLGILLKASVDSLVQNQINNSAQIQEGINGSQLYTKTDLGVLAGIGFARRFGGRITFKTGLNISYSINDIEVAKFKPLNRGESQNATVGVHFGLFYLFRKID
jgi:hypothetical protein